MNPDGEIRKRAERAVESGMYLREFLQESLGQKLVRAPLLECVPHITDTGNLVLKPNPLWNADPLHSEIARAAQRVEDGKRFLNRETLFEEQRTLENRLADVVSKKRAISAFWLVVLAACCFLMSATVIVAEGYQFALPYFDWVGVDHTALNDAWEQSWTSVVSGFLFAGVVVLGMFFIAYKIEKLLDDWRHHVGLLCCLTALLAGTVFGISYMRHTLSGDATSGAGVPTLLFFSISLIGLYAAALCAGFGVRLTTETSRRNLEKAGLQNEEERFRADLAQVARRLDLDGHQKEETSLRNELKRYQARSREFLDEIASYHEKCKGAFIQHARRVRRPDLITQITQDAGSDPPQGNQPGGCGGDAGSEPVILLTKKKPLPEVELELEAGCP